MQAPIKGSIWQARMSILMLSFQCISESLPCPKTALAGKLNFSSGTDMRSIRCPTSTHAPIFVSSKGLRKQVTSGSASMYQDVNTGSRS